MERKEEKTTYSKNNTEAELSIAREMKKTKINVPFTTLHSSGDVGHNESLLGS